VNKSWKEIVEQLMFRITSGRFIMTVIIGLVYAYLACTGNLNEDRINEITLIVIYAYFTKDRPITNIKNENDEEPK